MPASEVRLLVGQEVWDSYYKWCVERHPWDKVLSYYYHRHQNPATRPPLSTFIESGGAQRAINFRLYTIGAEVAVDHVARYEQLSAELERIAALLDLPAEATVLPRAKTGSRTDRRHYAAVYTPVERDLVEELFANEIALHGLPFRGSDYSRHDNGLTSRGTVAGSFGRSSRPPSAHAPAPHGEPSFRSRVRPRS